MENRCCTLSLTAIFFLHPPGYSLLLCKPRSKAALLHEAETQSSAEASVLPGSPSAAAPWLSPTLYLSAAPTASPGGCCRPCQGVELTPGTGCCGRAVVAASAEPGSGICRAAASSGRL